ncbi:unnamed protein product, partial [Musa acuminata subsp. burmannicoides]
MAAVRPLVTVQPLEGHMATNALAGVPRLDVLKAPMRPDVVRFVHASLSRNSRQPCAYRPRRLPYPPRPRRRNTPRR